MAPLFAGLFLLLAVPAPAPAKDAPPTVKAAARPDAWWTERHGVMNTRAATGKYNLLMIGDSITQGWEGAGLDVWEAVYRDRGTLNLGIGGDQTQHVLKRLEDGNIAGQQPKLAVIMIGTNNSGVNTGEEIAAGITAIVTKLREKLPETKVLILGIFPRGADENDPKRKVNKAANEIAAKLADDKMVFYLDIGPKFLAADGTLSKEIMPDLLHLSPKGYQIWAEAVEPTIAKLLGEEPKNVAELVAARAKQPVTVRGVPRDGGWLKRHLGFNQRVAKGNADVIFIGDSITQAWEGDGKEAWEKHFAKRNAVNLGISGDRTEHVLWRLSDGNLDGISPKLAVIMIGTNNSGSNKPEEISAGITAIIEKLRKAKPEMKILLLGIFPRGENNDNPQRKTNAAVNETVAKLADDKMVFFLDIGPKFLAADGTLSKEIMPDLLHLSPKGYTIWAESIEPSVAKLLGE